MEVGVVRTHYDGHAELRRLERVVAARRKEASADKRDRRDRIDRRQFPYSVEQNDLPCADRLDLLCRPVLPERTFDPFGPGLLKQRSHRGEALRMTWRKHQRQLRICFANFWPSLQQRS